METAYGGDVASHGADGQVLVAAGMGRLDNPADEQAANAPIPSCLSDHDRLDFATPAPVKQTGQTDDPATELGHPRSHPPRLGEVVIKSRSRIVSTDRRVPIDASVVLRQLCPQGPASAVVAFGVVANDNLRRGWRAWLPWNRHGLMLPAVPVRGPGPAADLPLHVRPGLGRGLPDPLIPDRQHRPPGAPARSRLRLPRHPRSGHRPPAVGRKTGNSRPGSATAQRWAGSATTQIRHLTSICSPPAFTRRALPLDRPAPG